MLKKQTNSILGSGSHTRQRKTEMENLIEEKRDVVFNCLTTGEFLIPLFPDKISNGICP